jgi:hypothetical protein
VITPQQIVRLVDKRLTVGYPQKYTWIVLFLYSDHA